MKHIPDAMQGVANDQRNREPETENTEHSEHNHRSDFQSPRFLVLKIGGERQIESRDCNEKQGKKICSPFAENNFCAMKMDPAAAKIPMPRYRTMIIVSAIWKS